ncbi:MAG TPA: hypothetical protein VNU72_00800 [Puia sp.]|jgi:hypothetical protein|nr:hypothetical protein [Puia sp.]
MTSDEYKRDRNLNLMMGGLIVIGAGAAVWVLPSVGQAIGLAGKTFKDGVAKGVVFNSLVTGCGVVSSVGITVLIVRPIIRGATKNPFEWLMPFIALLGALVTDLCGELFTKEEYVKIVYKAIFGALFLAGGVLWRKPDKWLKAVAIVFFLAPPVATVGKYMSDSNLTLAAAIKDMPDHLRLAILCFIVIFVLTMIMASKLKK